MKDGNFGILDSRSVETDETSCMIFRFNIPVSRYIDTYVDKYINK